MPFPLHPMIYLHLDDFFRHIPNLFLFFLETYVPSSGLQLMGGPIQSGRTESAFRETICCPSYWKAKSHRFLEFKNGTDSSNSTEKSIPTLWSSTSCERKAEYSLGLKKNLFFLFFILLFWRWCSIFLPITIYLQLGMFLGTCCISGRYNNVSWALSRSCGKRYFNPLQVKTPRRMGYWTPKVVNGHQWSTGGSFSFVITVEKWKIKNFLSPLIWRVV